MIFDLDPQAPEFAPDKIRQMAEYFIESSDMGKLYLNYPMVEAFYHMAFIPDAQIDSYYATLWELEKHVYKARVNRENRNDDYRKFAVTKEECNIVIKQHTQKQDSITVIVNGRPITIFFASEPNKEAADYIKKALINAYLVKPI